MADHVDTDSARCTSPPRQMLNEGQVLDIVPVGRTTLYSMVKAGRFPKGTYISPNRRVWFADDVARWQAAIGELQLFNPNRGRGKGRRPRATKHTADNELAKKESRSSP
jgi:prophage regulatory protein